MTMLARKDQGRPPYPYGRITGDDEVLAEILNALHHNCGTPTERIRVEVWRGHAVLSGVVEQEFQRSLAENIAASAMGVVDVTNLITLAG